MFMKKIEGGEVGAIKLTKIEDGYFISPFKVFICRLVAFGSFLLKGLLSIFMLTFWTFRILIQTTLIQYNHDTSEYIQSSEHAKIFLCIYSLGDEERKK